MRKWLAGALVMLGVGIAGVVISFDKDDIMDFGTKPYFEEKIIDADTVRSINLGSNSLSINTVKGSSDDVIVRLEGRANAKYLDRFKLKTEQKGDTLYIDGSVDNDFSFGLNIVNVKMTVELPERVWDSFEVDNQSGNVKLSDLKGKIVNVKGTSGNLNGDELQADELVYAVSSGTITLSDISAKNTDLKATSGNIKVNDFSSDKLSFKLSSGNIELKDGVSEVSGSLNSGNVRIDVLEIVKPIKVDVTSGNISVLTDKEPESAQINLRTSSGSTRIDWPSFNAANDNDKKLSGTVGTGNGVQIDLETTSGNIKLSH